MTIRSLRASRTASDLVDEPWIWNDAADPDEAAFWTLEEYRTGPLRIGAHITSFDEYFRAAEAGLAIGTPPESAVRSIGSAFPELALVPLRGSPPATVAVAWRTAHETDAAGQLSLMRMTCRPGGEPPRHVHAHEDELFYILEGDSASRSAAAGNSPVPGRACARRAACRTAFGSRLLSCGCSRW